MPPNTLNQTYPSSISKINGTQYTHLTAKPSSKDSIWHNDKVANDKILSNYAKKNKTPPFPVWRYKNRLYDLREFYDKHPGGRIWLERTKNSDITDYVLSFHFNDKKIELILKKYEISGKELEKYDFHIENNNKIGRPGSFLSFEENGFYMTLKKRVYKKLGDKTWKFSTKNLIVHYILAFLAVSTFLYSAWSENYKILLISCILSVLLMGSSHVYTHKRPIFARYFFDISFFPLEAWYTSHVLSHHTFPNSFWDIELETSVPVLNFNHFHKSSAYKIISFFF